MDERADRPETEVSGGGGGRPVSPPAPTRTSAAEGVRLVVWLSVSLAVASVVLVLLLPSPGTAVVTSPWWTAILVAAGFAAAERTVFHIEYGREAISFSLSEVPTAFALVFLAPSSALLARVVGSLVVIMLLWRPPPHKLAFNGALFAFEVALAFTVLRHVSHPSQPADALLLLGIVLAVTVATTAGSVLVSLVISVFEGEPWKRVTAELRSSGWLHPVSGSIAAIAVAPALISPPLAALSMVPIGVVWAILRSHGVIGQRFRDLEAVHGFAGVVGRSLELSEIVDAATGEARRLLRAERAALVVYSAGESHLSVADGGPISGLPRRVDDARWTSIVAGPGAQLLDRRAMDLLGLAVGESIPDLILAPVRDGQDVIGLLALAERAGARERFDASDAARVQSLAEQLAASLRKGLLHERMEHEARHDALTDLPNRTSFERRVDEAAAARHLGDLLFVMMLDLDRFKEVNDTLGHHVGDRLLVDFARRIAGVLGDDDVLARFGGDEFAVLGTRQSQPDVDALALEIVHAAQRPFTLDGLDVVVNASIGVAVMTEPGDDPALLMRRADIAMYRAKGEHSGFQLYRDELDRRTPARLSLLGDLRRAIERAELDVHFQPKLDLATGTVISAEALVRWQHPVRGPVPPIEFVRIAEESGLIKRLTDLVLTRGITTLHRLEEHGRHLGLAVNLSAHDLLDEHLVDRVADRLDEHQVDPALLTLEITETALLADSPRTRMTVQRLHDLGVGLSIDDFGTGYSSLSYLRRLPVTELKIDRSFVANLMLDEQDEVIVRSTIDLGHNLGLGVVAEGVESDEVLERLRVLGCDIAQGFGISRPLPLDQLLVWLDTTKHHSRRVNPYRPDGWDEGRLCG